MKILKIKVLLVSFLIFKSNFIIKKHFLTIQKKKISAFVIKIRILILIITSTIKY